jgi:hypothetical protein
MRNACIGACLALMALAPVASGAAGEKLPDGSVIAGVAVGGLGPNAARAEVRRQLEPVLESPLDIRVRARRYSVPTGKLGLVVLYADMVTAAYAQAHRGEQVDVPLMRTIDRTRMRAAVSGLAPRFYRPSRSARVQLGIRRVKIIHGRTGRALDVGELRRKVLVELRSPTARRRVWGHVRWLRPAVRVRDLRRLAAGPDRATLQAPAPRAPLPRRGGRRRLRHSGGAASRAVEAGEPDLVRPESPLGRIAGR